MIANFINSNITVKLLSDIIFAEYFHKNEPGHEKMCLMSYANNKGTDQPVHPKFQDSSQLLWLHRLVCVWPGRKLPKTHFVVAQM